MFARILQIPPGRSEIREPWKRICVCRAPHARKVGKTEILPWNEYFELLRSL